MPKPGTPSLNPENAAQWEPVEQRVNEAEILKRQVIESNQDFYRRTRPKDASGRATDKGVTLDVREQEHVFESIREDRALEAEEQNLLQREKDLRASYRRKPSADIQEELKKVRVELAGVQKRRIDWVAENPKASEALQRIGSHKSAAEIMGPAEELPEKAEELLGGEESLERQLVSLRFVNLRVALEQNRELEQQRNALLERQTRVRSGIEGTPTGAEQRELADLHDELAKIETKRRELLATSPEAFYGLHLRELQGYKHELEHGRIAELPYTEEKADEVESHLRAGNAVMLHGDLGSGKTELAMHVARKMLTNREDLDAVVQERFQEWLLKNPEASAQDQKIFLDDMNREHRSAVVISGSKHTAPGDFFGHQVLTVGKMDKNAQDSWITGVEDRMKEWKKKNPNASEADTERHFQATLEAYRQQGGTVSEYFLGPIYQAAKEGRPVIIDEANAIEHQALISLNYIMTRRPGEMVTVPQTGEMIKIKPGFGFILTGNLNKGGVETYKQRQDLDPAFLNRLKPIEYDYLPQKYGVRPDEAGEVENQQFKLVIAKMMDRNGNIEGPKGTLEQLWYLAGFARLTQEVFAGRKIADQYFFDLGAGRGKVKPPIKNAVMSIRTIEQIINHWKADGQKKELDYYVWKDYIESSSDPNERAYLYQVARTQFSFFQGPGWEQNPDYGAGSLQHFEVKVPDAKVTEKEFFGPRQLVEATFGKAPERAKWPEENAEVAKQQLEEQLVIERSKELKELEETVGRYGKEIEELRQEVGSMCNIDSPKQDSSRNTPPILVT